MPMSPSRKPPGSIVRQIIDVLADRKARTTNEIALAIKSNTSTVKKWVDLVVLAQDLPKLKVERTKNVTLVRLD